tara:strand:+ start:275 stop:580 length:306 start_codon:yes stop_codon:yes gene_type:complete
VFALKLDELQDKSIRISAQARVEWTNTTVIRWVVQDIGATYQRKLSGINDGGHRVLKGNAVQSGIVGTMITRMVDDTQDATRLESCYDLTQKILGCGRLGL